MGAMLYRHLYLLGPWTRDQPLLVSMSGMHMTVLYTVIWPLLAGIDLNGRYSEKNRLPLPPRFILIAHVFCIIHQRLLRSRR